MDIVILGAGAVGQALGVGWVAAGHRVRFTSREPDSERARAVAQRTGIDYIAIDSFDRADAIVIALPWAAVREQCERIAARAAGAVVLDASNPLAPGLQLAIGHTTSGGEAVAAWLPGVRVVKIFNSTGFANMADPVYGPERATMLYAGDAAEACAVAHGLAADLGFEPVAAGPLSEARTLEPLALLWIRLATRQKLGFGIAFKLLRR